MIIVTRGVFHLITHIIIHTILTTIMLHGLPVGPSRMDFLWAGVRVSGIFHSVTIPTMIFTHIRAIILIMEIVVSGDGAIVDPIIMETQL